ncbi:hypothetical protein N7540_002170 [Penicillium herquei]|nr:hypothetical protein N7540_002170 [Penicillium herquei]
MFPIAHPNEPSIQHLNRQSSLGILSQHLSVEISQEDAGNHQSDGTFVAPKCALLFDNLRNATWRCFGAPMYTFDMRLVHITAVETNQIYAMLQSRLGLIQILQEYEEATKEAESKGMMEQDSHIFASRKVMMTIEKSAFSSDKHLDDFIQGFDSRIKAAQRLKCLLDIVGSQEVFLVSFDDETIDDLGDIPIPEITEGTDEEWACLLSRLQDPKFQLKETCFKLSGVVNMIQKLDGLDDCDLRSFLASEIQRRAKEVLGPSNHSNDSEGEDDDDDSMPDVE